MDHVTIRSWLLMRMDRLALTAAILLLSFLALVGVSHLGLTPLRAVAMEENAIDSLFSAFIGAIITGTAIVVTINQLVLSQELGAVGDQYERMREATSFRRDVERAVDTSVAPPEPTSFFTVVLESIESQAKELESTASAEPDAQTSEAVIEYATALGSDARHVMDELEGAQFGTFDLIWNAMGFNYSWYRYRARELRAEYSGSMTDQTDDALGSIVENLTLVAPTREHFKTLYFQWELIDLSRAMLYIAVPSLLVTASFVLYVDASTLPGETAGVDNLVWLTSAGFTAGIAPFVVFIAYLLRIATVAKRTLAMGPFILQEQNRDGETD